MNLEETMNLEEIYRQLEEQKNKRQGIVEGKIIDIQVGTIRDFVRPESIEKFRNPDANCLQLTIETPDGYAITKLLTISVAPQSNLQRYYRRYGCYPKVGSKYPLKFDGRFWRPADL